MVRCLNNRWHHQYFESFTYLVVGRGVEKNHVSEFRSFCPHRLLIISTMVLSFRDPITMPACTKYLPPQASIGTDLQLQSFSVLHCFVTFKCNGSCNGLRMVQMAPTLMRTLHLHHQSLYFFFWISLGVLPRFHPMLIRIRSQSCCQESTDDPFKILANFS